MNCKHCNAELEEGVTVCPVCGKENAEEEEVLTEQASEEAVEETSVEEPVEEAVPEKNKKKAGKKLSKIGKTVLIAVCGVALLGILVCAVLYGLGFRFRANDSQYKSVYTVSDAKAEKAADTVIATAGGRELTNGELQVYYLWEVINFLSSNSGYLASLNMNYTEPLSEQTCYYDPELTWEQYFIDAALETWYQSAVLCQLADEAGYTPSAELQELIDAAPEKLEELVEELEFESVQAMLMNDFGPAVTVQGYINYQKDYYYGLGYYSEKYAQMIPTREEAETYFAENQEQMAQYEIVQDGSKYYNVRHILIGVEEDTDAAWEDCKEEAQKILDAWKDGEATEESFAALAEEHSIDDGSNTNGGLYDMLTAETNFVEEFKTWYMDESRENGDTGLVKSVYGYHIMYFSDSEEIWEYNVKSLMLSERTEKMLDDAKARWPMAVSFRKLILGEMTF